MKTYLLLLRGVNVGGKNKLPMATLRKYLEDIGFTKVTTYIASGNVIVQTNRSAREVKELVASTLPKVFAPANDAIKLLVLTPAELRAIVADKPKRFGDQPDKYHSDVIFLIDITAAQAMSIFRPREGVDAVWPGNSVVYSQRLSALRTKSRLSTIMLSPLYKSMTIRSWTTTIKLLELLTAIEQEGS